MRTINHCEFNKGINEYIWHSNEARKSKDRKKL